MMWDWMAMPQVVQGLVSCYYERPFCLAAVEAPCQFNSEQSGEGRNKKSDFLINCGCVI